MQSRTKINIAIIAIIALVILWMIPATIEVPAKSLNQEDDRGSEIKPIRLVNHQDEDGIFYVLNDKGNIESIIDVDIRLDDNIKEFGAGYICASRDKLALDGSYEYSYDFFLQREGNMLQSLLTKFGIINFNYSTSGHVNGDNGYQYTDEARGFTAAFPNYPENLDNDASRKTEFEGIVDDFTLLYGSASWNNPESTQFTSIEYGESAELGSMMGEIAEQAGDDYIEYVYSELVKQSLLRYVDGKSAQTATASYSYAMGEIGGFRSCSAIAPFLVFDENGKETGTSYFYAVIVITDDCYYSLTGARNSNADAQRAVDSFQLI